MANHFRPLTVFDIRNETPDCISIAFSVPEKWKQEFQYKAGQNITVRSTINGEEVRRSYSICSSPHENELRIAIKKIESGKFSSHAHEKFKLSDQIEVLSPTGNFFLPVNAGNKKHYTAFAAGSGITPVISIIKNILNEEPESSVTLVYGNRNRQNVIFREELQALKNIYPENFQLIHIFSREKMDAPIFEGRIDAAKCEALYRTVIPVSDHQEYLLCGPSEMIFSIRDWLSSKGVSERNIHFELFGDPATGIWRKEKAVLPVNTSRKSKVTIRLDGVSTDFDLPVEGVSILDAAILVGADLPYACRAGVCATCRAKLVQGKVIMDQNYALAEEEVEQGFILTCQSHPASEKLIVDFDIR